MKRHSSDAHIRTASALKFVFLAKFYGGNKKYLNEHLPLSIKHLPLDCVRRPRQIISMLFFAALVLSAALNAQTPSGSEILANIDQNIRAANRVSTSRMIIHGRRASRTITARSWVQGMKKSFTEYLAPPRDQGTKMLKLEDELWTYSPTTDRTIKISGHMLRQSVMGSDLSYEDYMEDPELSKMYDAEVVGAEPIGDRACWVLSLTARNADVAYHSRKIWVDKERYLPLREERFAKSGKLLKTTEILEVMYQQDRWVVKHIRFKDVLKNGEGTELWIDEIEYDVDIPEYRFSKAALRK